MDFSNQLPAQMFKDLHATKLELVFSKLLEVRKDSLVIVNFQGLLACAMQQSSENLTANYQKMVDALSPSFHIVLIFESNAFCQNVYSKINKNRIDYVFFMDK